MKVSLLFIGLLFFTCFTAFSQPQQKEKKYDHSKLFKYTADPDPNQTKALAIKEYTTCPPLRLERFRRRVKMLWAIDVNDYAPDAEIWFGVLDYRLSLKYQIIVGFYQFNSDDPFSFAPPPREIYRDFRKDLLYNDQEVYENLEKWRNSLDPDGLYYSDVLTMQYNSVMTVNPYLIKYIDKYPDYDYSRLSNLVENIDTPVRVSDVKEDLLILYIQEQLKKGRNFASDWHTPKGLWLGFDPAQSSWLNLGRIASPYNSPSTRRTGLHQSTPWKNPTKERDVASNLAYMLQFKTKQINKTIIQYMSGQLDYDGDGIRQLSKPRQEKIRSDIKSNNYYGYAVLREFCENPMREMPTLEKIGTNFRAKVKEQNTLLLLEPFADSYDIDTIQPTETLKAYEMGHDDYYFVEVVKPVESPIADKDGYAMILDRTETVYGYLPKSKVKAYTSQEVLQESQYTDKAKSKRGVILDKDGYVNIRKEPNTQSEIVGKIMDKEIFHYWQTSDNWYIVETTDAKRGYVYKERIREKYDTGGWTLDE